MIKRPSGMAIASVKLSPNRKELRNILIILGEDAEGISFWDVERDRGTIERKDSLQGRADSTQQLILTQFRNDRVVYFKTNAEALLRRPCRTRIARNGGRLPGLLLFSVSRSHHIKAYCRDRGILHVHVSVNPEVRANSRLSSKSWMPQLFPCPLPGCGGSPDSKFSGVLGDYLAALELSSALRIRRDTGTEQAGLRKILF